MGGHAKIRYRERYSGVQIDLSADTQRELNEKIRKKKNAIDSGLVAGSDSVSVAVWCEEWLNVYKSTSITEKSVRNYRYLIHNQILPAIGTMRVSDVRSIHLQKILSAEQGRSVAHVKHLRMTLRQIFGAAVKNGIISRDPSESLELSKTVEGTHRPLTDDEAAGFLAACAACEYGLYGRLLYYFGLRPSEAAALAWSDVNITSGIIYIRRAIEAGKRNTKPPKTQAGIRDIPIPAAMLDELREGCASHEQQERVLRTHTGVDADCNALNRWWKAIMREWDIQQGAIVYRNQIIKHSVDQTLTAYCLRHTYCTNLQRAGVPINVAKYLMGHDDIKMTAKIYTTHTSDTTETARKLLNSFLCGSECGSK